MNTSTRAGWLATPLLIFRAAFAFGEPAAPSTITLGVAAAQAARRVVDFRFKPAEALAAVERNLTELERIVDRAGQAKCDALVRPEDTLGLLNWVGANEPLVKEVLPNAVKGMITAFERLRKEYPATWIDQRSQERLAKLPPAALQPEMAALRGTRPSSGAATSEAATVVGLAATYPNDAGIASDPAVLFADNFESGDMRKWDQQRGRVVMTEDKPNAGRWCVQMPMERGKNHGGDAIKWFMPGADAVYARCYVKFSPDYQYNHHFLWLGANQRTNKWSAFGKAGLKPNGTYYSTGMEPWFAWGKNPPPGEVNLYTYYLDMEPDRKMDKYWGNGFFPPGPGKGTAASAARVIPPLNQWQCWEFMIQANTASDKSDGKQAMWVDGKLVGEFTGIRWRDDLDLKVNCFWLEHYGYDEGDPTKQYWKDSQSVWFDDVVVASRYIGPMKR
jgi:hypothetical protein